MSLVQPERLDNDIICPDDTGQTPNEFSAEKSGVVGEFDAVATAALENLQGKAIVPRVRDKDSIALPQAQVIAHLIYSGA